MKTTSKIFMVLISLMFIAACATTGKIAVPEKYNLSNKLEQVTEINRVRIMDWEDIDNQSLIIETAPSEYYLVVLMIPSPEIYFRNRISITHSGSQIRAGLDSVIVSDGARMRQSYPIDRMYKIKGYKQMIEIMNQLTGTKGNESGKTVKQNNDNDKGTV